MPGRSLAWSNGPFAAIAAARHGKSPFSSDSPESLGVELAHPVCGAYTAAPPPTGRIAVSRGAFPASGAFSRAGT
jgi:hypothetical protein